HSHSSVSRFHQVGKQSYRRPPEAIPTSQLLRGTTPFSLSRWVLGTQQSARFRCLGSPGATSTPLLALDHLTLTLRMQIRPLVPQRFCLILPAHKTQLSEQPRLNLTIPAATTRAMERLRFLTTPPEAKTRPMVPLRFLTMSVPTITRPPATKRS